jgi:hypothetical protein
MDGFDLECRITPQLVNQGPCGLDAGGCLEAEIRQLLLNLIENGLVYAQYLGKEC